MVLIAYQIPEKTKIIEPEDIAIKISKMEDRDSGQGAGAQHQRPVGQYQSTLSAARVGGCNGGSSRDKTVI